MKARPTPAQVTAAQELLAAAAARIGADYSCGFAFIGESTVACVSGGAKVVVLSVAGFDGHTVFEAMPATFRTPDGKPSQVWEVVALIAERMAERIRREPEMARLAAKAGPSRAPGETHYTDGKEVRHG